MMSDRINPRFYQNIQKSSSIDFCENASDFRSLEDLKYSKDDIGAESRPQNCVSFQDIHSEYTKRQYSHVESKVGQYIANLKSEGRRHRNFSKFKRYNSMPETQINSENHPVLGNNYQLVDNGKSKLQGQVNSNTFSPITGMHKTPLNDDASKSNFPSNILNSAIQNDSSYSNLFKENERIQSYNNHLESKLDDKIGEIIRLKRNLDYMRIELSNCNDKLKRKPTGSCPCNILGSMSIKSTQTEILTNTQATNTFIETENDIVPNSIPDYTLTKYLSNNKSEKHRNNAPYIQSCSTIFGNTNKSIDIIQGSQKKTSNSSLNRQHLEQTGNSNNSKDHIHPSGSSDSAIDMEFGDSPKFKCWAYKLNMETLKRNLQAKNDEYMNGVQLNESFCSVNKQRSSRKYYRWISMFGPCFKFKKQKQDKRHARYTLLENNLL